MYGTLKVLMLAAVIMLVSAQTFKKYRSLPEILRKHVDKALTKANNNFGKNHHVAFLSLREPPKLMEQNLNINVLLQVTTCEKASTNVYEHRDECDQRKSNTPLIDCLVCKRTLTEELVDCATLREVNNRKRDNVRKICDKYYHGDSTLFQISDYTEEQIGCIGCV